MGDVAYVFRDKGRRQKIKTSGKKEEKQQEDIYRWEEPEVFNHDRRYRDEGLERCRALARNVILRAAEDVKKGLGRDYEDAKRWFLSDDKWLHWWCRLADIDVSLCKELVGRLECQKQQEAEESRKPLNPSLVESVGRSYLSKNFGIGGRAKSYGFK